MLTVGFPIEREAAENVPLLETANDATLGNEESTTARLESLFQQKGKERLTAAPLG